MAEANGNGNNANGKRAWIWQAALGVLFTGVGVIVAGGFQFRDEARDRLTLLEKDFYYMHLSDMEQKSRIEILDQQMRDKSDYIIGQLEDIEARLRLLTPQFNQDGPQRRPSRAEHPKVPAER